MASFRDKQYQLTPQEAVDMMRLSGVSIGVDTLKAGMFQRVFPFGVCIERSTTLGVKSDVYIIWRKQLEDYIRGITGHEPKVPANF